MLKINQEKDQVDIQNRQIKVRNQLKNITHKADENN